MGQASRAGGGLASEDPCGMKMTLGVGAWALGGGEARAGGLIGEGEVGHPLVPGLPWEGPTFGNLTSW